MVALRNIIFASAYSASALAKQYCTCENSDAAIRYVGIQEVCTELSTDWCTSSCDEFGENCDLCNLNADGEANAEDMGKLDNWCKDQQGFNADTGDNFSGGTVQCYSSAQDWMEVTECFACADCENDQLSHHNLVSRAFQPYKPPEYEFYTTDSNNLVSSGSKALLEEAGNYALYKVTEVHSLGYGWISQFDQYTGEGQGGSVSKTVKLGFSFKSGTETTNSVSAALGAAASGVSFTFEAKTEKKTFNTQERSEETSTTRTFQLKENVYTNFYQRQIEFETEVWYKLDIRGKVRTVGSPSGNGVAQRTIPSVVKLNSFALLGGQLTDNTTVTVKTVQSKENKDDIIPWGEIPRRLQRILRDDGV
ncbi:hypothetical protein NM208_g8554 [Fusarium decemcellulare]|uniref:Uncharacterized protein n=1 Tax=Fusarium decemcellulare TaxID=57161 RepID=A0ACC1S4W2_9HYPO|nr:hypothetical protein NM208_g8554 [Fusarium decemcellulare]